MYLEPSAPPLLDVIKDELVYNCELGCDVEFLVGIEPIRIPVHSCKLLEYPVFKAMLSENFAGEMARGKLKQVSIRDVDPKGFDNLMRFIYGKPLCFELQTIEMVIETLGAAHKYLFPELVRECVLHLSKLISQSNVLWIYASARFLCNDFDNLEELTKSEELNRPIPKRRKSPLSDFSAGLEIKRLCVWLLGQTLAFIDVHANHVLQSEEIEMLDGPFLEFLLRRDSLDVSETVVFSALVRWAENQCKRRHLTLTPESKRLVLHDLLYLCRFFIMTESEYRSIEDSSVLSPEENEIIKNMIAYNRPYFGKFQTIPLGLYANWKKMGEPRSSQRAVGRAKKRKWSGKETGEKRKSSFKWPLVKSFGQKRRRNTDSVIDYQNYRQQTEEKADGKKKESTLSKFFYLSVNIFAFFFD